MENTKIYELYIVVYNTGPPKEKKIAKQKILQKWVQQ